MSPLLSLIAAAARGGQVTPPALTPDMQNTPTFNAMVADFNAQHPATPPATAQTPEPQQVTAPLPDAGPSAPVPASAAPTHHGGILGALKSVFMPQADSLWAGALRDGIWNAHASQDAYRQNQGMAAIKGQQALVDLQTARDKALKGDVITTPTGSITRIKPDGTLEKLYEPPQKQGETLDLIDKWHAARDAGDATTMALLERAIKGFQYTPGVIADQGAARTATGVAIQRARPKPVGRAAAGAKIPGGYILQP